MNDVEMGEKRNIEESQGHNRYQPLYEAAKNGDWKKAEEFIYKVGKEEAVTAQVTVSSDTALHVSATEGHSTFVEQLVSLMTELQLESKNDNDETALQMAVLVGNIESIRTMVGKNKNLTLIADKDDAIPIVNAANFSPRMEKKEIIKYLYNVMMNNAVDQSSFSGDLGRKIICSIIDAGFYDVALDIIESYPHLALERTGGHCALEMMAGSPNAFLCESQLSFWDQFIYSLPGIDVGNKKLKNEEAVCLVNRIFEIMCSTKTSSEIKEYFSDTKILEIAITTGAIDLLIMCLDAFPGLIWIPLGEQGLNIFSIAIMRRQENIFNLVYHINGFQKKMASTKDHYGNTILHLAALCNFPRQTNQGYCIALQIQRELQWFQEVESLLPLEFRIATNNDKHTPQKIFDLEHNKAIADAEKWTKDTSLSCTFVSALIATVAFASTFAVPGGIFSDSSDIKKRGIPVFLHKTDFMVFAVANAVALFSSISSLLLFLGLQTSQFKDDDYLRFIPKRLIMGFLTLFISIVTLMIAFCATLHIILGPRFERLPIPLSLAASIPVGLFIWSQLSLFVKMVASTYGRSIFRRGQH
ncbi:hypothetical protein MKW92_026318 [Papaver armeniacum]|nr:hypothetical protein MKW92_026318 [Papaver armeniacum]